MKKITIIIAAIALLLSLFVFIEKAVTAEIPNDKTSQKIISEGYQTTINNVTINIKSGTNYDNCKNIENAVSKTPDALLAGIEEIIISTEHPILSLNPEPSEAQKEDIKNHPDIDGIHVGSISGSDDPDGEKIKKSRIALRDDDEIVGVYVHELTHHLNFVKTVNGNSLCDLDEFKSLYASVTSKASTKDDIMNQWISELCPEEFIAYMVEFNYTDNNKNYHKLITEEYPEVGEYLDKMFAELIE